MNQQIFPTTLQRTKWLSGLSLALMIILSIAIGLYAIAFQARVTGDPGFQLRFSEYSVTSSMHVIGGAVVIILGGFQFSTWLRQHYTQVHRWTGRIYLIFVLIGGVGGLMIAPQSAGGPTAHFGFGLLALLWLFSGWQAYACIRRRDIQAHRAWMMRNYAMTFGAVTLRIYLGLLAGAGVDFPEAYPLVAWLSWVPNLIIVEWYLALKAQGLNASG